MKSSYAREIELPLETDADVPDAVQWWIAETGTWRIRTYALDHDIHTHRIGGKPDDHLGLAIESNRRHYKDVIGAEHVVALADCSDLGEVRTRLDHIGLVPLIEVAAGRFAFWKPDNAEYATKSRPK